MVPKIGRAILPLLLTNLFQGLAVTIVLAETALHYHSPKIESTLVELLDTVVSYSAVSVELKVAGAISPHELGEYLDTACATLDERRRIGLDLLHRTAAKQQGALLTYLNGLQQSGLASKVVGHWLTNSISLTLPAAFVDSLASRVDIESIKTYPPKARQIDPIEPLPQPLELRIAAGVESNLTYIGADTAWQMGYTGKGRIVCVFDMSGVDGHHPALENNWKGKDGDSLAAWHGSGMFPNPEQSWDPDTTHGTKLVSILVGHDDGTGDTVGVAPGAEWIASWWPSWEWAADPDMDPNTTADIPDVINISMGDPAGCYDLWTTEIDMVEALGIVVIIAAGNSGPSPYTIWSPAARAVDSITNFAVGSIDHRYSDISWRSSRGPSPCDSASIKPNVCAPGAFIRCAIPGSSYMFDGGTSFATPHVSGAVAIMRQYAPNATVRQIKEALLAGATPRGESYPNNTYGWGVISIPRSLEYLRQNARADLRIADVSYSPANIDDTLRAGIGIMNRGQAIDSVYLKLSPSGSGLRVITDSLYFGRINYHDTAIAAEQLRCVFDDTLLPGPTLPVAVEVHAAGGYLDTLVIHLKAGIPGTSRETWMWSDWWGLELTNYGAYGMLQYLLTVPPCPDPCPDTANYYAYYDYSLLLGEDSNRVSDACQTWPFDTDIDFWIDSAHPFVISQPGVFAEHETECMFNDGMAENQIGLEVRQKTYHWSSASAADFIIIEYELHNPTAKQVDSCYVGLMSRLSQYWGPPCPTLDSQIFQSRFSDRDRMGYITVAPCPLDTTRLMGVGILSRDGRVSYSADKREYGQMDSITEGDKFSAMTGGVLDSGLSASADEVLCQYLSVGPFSLAPDEYDTAAFVILTGRSPDELLQTLADARRKWKQVSPSQNLPESFILRQNYPNPFNPKTTIPFDLPVASKVRLTVLNLLGQEVAVLVNGPMNAGSHLVEWNGISRRGSPVASGVYFYRLQTPAWSRTRKMLLLK